jgi:hypothetical protein
MLRYFFEKTENKQSEKKLFSNLLIEKEEVFKKHSGGHPVIFLTFKDVKALNFEQSLSAIKLLIAKEYRRHKYLLKSDALNNFEKENFNKIASANSDISILGTSLLELSHHLCKHHKQKPIILIDEYDTPIHTAYEENYYKEIISFFRTFLGAGLKDNKYIFKGVLTGILRVAKESIFSDMNNLGVYSILNNKFSDKFGMTEPEVIRLLNHYNIDKKITTIQKWYDGYIFGETSVYNPWSIINYASNINEGAKAYWVNTSSNHIIKKLITKSPQTVKQEIYNLLKNIPVTKRIEENIAFEDINKSETSVYSFLLFCGYLKAFDKQKIEGKNYYKLLIPNAEVKQVFEDVIISWLQDAYESYKLNAMLKALTTADIETFEQILNDFIIETFSYFDTAKKNVEKVYQAFLLGLLVNLTPDYEINSDRESGYGRYDISVIPKNTDKQAIIIELKTINKKQTAKQALEDALLQIEKKQYAKEIEKRGIKNILKLGVVFDGKEVFVKEGKPHI